MNNRALTVSLGLLPLFLGFAGAADTALFCDQIVSVREKKAGRVDNSIEQALRKRFPGSRTCTTEPDGGWYEKRLIAMYGIEFENKELNVCFDISAS